MEKTKTLFDVIGPVIIGPSSSHTAGAVRIGYLAGKIFGACPKFVKFRLYNSFAKTGKGHGTDKGLLGGVLGFDVDNSDIKNAFEIANSLNVKYEFEYLEDYNRHPNPGMIDLVYLFEHSSNVGAVLVAQMMSKYEFYNMLKKFGFGNKTGIDLPGESVGLLKSPARWDASDHASMGYGYGSSVTAIQMVAAIAAIANDGTWITPHVIKYTPEEEAIKIKKVQVMTPEHARVVTELLTESINRGKSPIKSDSFNIAAKTGTSIKPKENGSGYTDKLYTSIVGYMPSSDPQVLIYVIVDSAQGGEIWGNTVAAPIFKEISTQISHILNLQPDKLQVENEVFKKDI